MLVATLMLVRAALAQPQAIPSITKLAVGINMFRSQPDGLPSEGRDPALSTYPVFNFSASSGHTWNGVYSVPDELFFRPAPSCSYTSEVDTLRSSVGFLESLHKWSRTTERVLWWTHTDDQEFAETASQTTDSAFVLVKAKASCSAYQAAVDGLSLTPASLSADFSADVAALLPTVYSPAALPSLRQFVDTWGTHYIASAVLGGSATIITTFSQENFTRLEQESTNMPVAAGLSFLAAFGDQSLASDKNFNDYAAFSSSAVSESVMFVGPRPPQNASDARLNATGWAADILLPGGAPEIISYTAAPLAALVARAELFPGAPPGAASARAASLARFLSGPDFCATSAVPCAAFSRNSAWRDGPSLPFPLRGAGVAATADGSGVYAVGGALTGAPATAVSGTLLYNHSAGAVSLLPPPFYTANASAQGGLAGAAVACNASGDGALWAAGGVDAGGALQAGIARFDTAARLWRVQGGLAAPRTGHCAVAIGALLYVVGSVDSSGAPMGSMEVFSPAAGETVPGAPLPNATAGHACLALGGELWVLGGSVGAALAPAPSVWVYSPSADVWRLSPNTMLEPRSGHAAVQVGASLLLVAGGTDGSGGGGGAPVGGVLALNTTNGTFGGWFRAPPLPRPALAPGAGAVYEPHSDARVAAEGPDNGGWVVVLVGGAGSAAAGDAALGGTQLLKVYDSHGSLRYVPPSAGAAAAMRGRRGSAAAQLETAREAAKARAPAPAPAPAPVPAPAPARRVYPFIEFLSHSYNPLYATPGAQSDAGWLAASPFQVACGGCFSQGKKLGNFSLPNGVTARELSAAECAYSSASLTLRTAAEAAVSMSLFAQMDASLFGLGALLSEAFSLGAGGSLAASASATSNASLVATTARCAVAEVALDAYDFAPALSPSFASAVAALPPDTSDPAPWVAFCEAWGLAFPTRAALGGTASQLDLLTEASFAQYVAVDASVDSKASESFFFVFARSSDAGSDFSFKEWLSFSSSVAVNFTSCAPLCPPAGDATRTNASAWRDAVAAQPVPISFELAPLWLLLGGNSSGGGAGGGRFARTSLQAAAEARGDARGAARAAAAGDNLRSFVQSGAYCAALPGCGALGGKPLWERPLLAPARALPDARAGAVGGLLPPPGGGAGGGVVVVAGGATNTAPAAAAATASTLFFDTDAPELGWLSAAPCPTAVAHAAGVVGGGALWVLGGVPAGGAAATNGTFTYRLGGAGGGVWAAAPPLPVPLAHAAAVAVPSGSGGGASSSGAAPLLIVFGGCGGLALQGACAAPSQAIYLLNTAAPAPAWQPSSHALPSGPAWGLSAVAGADGAVVYVAGGRTAYALQGTPYLYAYDVARDVWDLLQTTAAPFAFSFSSALLMASGKLMFFGGICNDPTRSAAPAASTKVWSYDGSMKQWDAWPPAPWPSAAAVAVLLPSGPPGAAAAAAVNPMATLNATLPVALLVGGANDTDAFAAVAQLRNIPTM